MAFPSGSLIDVFDTQGNLTDSSALVADGDFSLASDLLVFTNTFNAITASIVFRCNFSVAPDAGSNIVLFAQPLDIDGAGGDQQTPSDDYLHDAVKTILVNNNTSVQLNSAIIDLSNIKEGQEFQFFFKNRTGQTIPAAWSILIAPKAVGVTP